MLWVFILQGGKCQILAAVVESVMKVFALTGMDFPFFVLIAG